MSSLGILALLVIFIASAAAVWLAGVKVSQTTDILSFRLGWGDAIGGLVALAVVTNLPETAIVLSGASRGDMSLALGNILGGIAAQTVVLALLDLFGPRGRGSLTRRVADPSVILEGLLVLAVLGLVLVGTQLPASAIAFRLTPIPPLIALTWLLGVRLIARYGRSLEWQLAEPGRPTAQGPSKKLSDMTTARAGVLFGIAAVVTLVAGVLLELSSDAIADHWGISGAVFGATILAAATSLPELSTGLTSIRLGNDELAIGDIFGGNAFLPVLFLPAVLITGKPLLATATASDVYLTSLGIVLTTIYLVGILVRPKRRVLGMGQDSALVLGAYVVALFGLAILPS